MSLLEQLTPKVMLDSIEDSIKNKKLKQREKIAKHKTDAQVADEFNLSRRIVSEYRLGTKKPKKPSVHYTRWELILEKYEFNQELYRWIEKT
jgi:hypothetical protein